MGAYRMSVYAFLLAGSVFAAAPTLGAEVTPNRLVNADKEPGNWLMNHRTYDAQRFSPLDKINKSNVKGLKLAYAVALGGKAADENLEATPACRRWLPVYDRQLELALQDRRPLGRSRPHRLAHGSRPTNVGHRQSRRRSVG